jgi:hypothetical protein
MPWLTMITATGPNDVPESILFMANSEERSACAHWSAGKLTWRVWMGLEFES